MATRLSVMKMTASVSRSWKSVAPRPRSQMAIGGPLMPIVVVRIPASSPTGAPVERRSKIATRPGSCIRNTTAAIIATPTTNCIAGLETCVMTSAPRRTPGIAAPTTSTASATRMSRRRWRVNRTNTFCASPTASTVSTASGGLRSANATGETGNATPNPVATGAAEPMNAATARTASSGAVNLRHLL